MAAVAVVAVVMAGVVALGARQAEAATDQADGGRATLEILRQTAVVDPEGAFELDLRVDGAPAGATVAARVFEPVESRRAFAPVLFGEGLGAGRTTLPPVDVAFSTPAPGGGRSVPVRLDLCSERPCGTGAVRLRTDGVYPVTVRLLDADGGELAKLVTFMVRRPDDPTRVTPVHVALTLPLHARPSVAADGTTSLGPDDLAPVEAVTSVLLFHPAVAVTAVPTPETVEALAAVDPELWRRLQLALEGGDRQVVAGTYVDLPLAGWVAAGLGDELDRQRVRGTDALEALVPDPDIRTWLADASLTESAALALQGTGVGRVVIDPAGLAPLDDGVDDGSGPPTRPFELETGTTQELEAVAIDPGLRSPFALAGTHPVLAANRIVAELAVLAYASPEEAKGAVVAPPPGWVPSAPFLDALLDGLAAADGLVRPVTVAGLFDAVDLEGADGGADDDGSPLRRRLAPRAAAPLEPYPAELTSARRLLDSYRSMIGPGNRRSDPYDDRLLVSASTDLTLGERRARVAAVAAAVDRELHGIEVPDRQTVTLTSAEGQLPLTIRNRLDYPVTVGVELRASQRVELDRPAQNLTLEANETRSLRFDVRARASGDTPVGVVVRAPDARVLATTRFQLRSTAVSGVGVLLTGGAAAFLVLWWFRHVRLVRLERERADPAR